MIIVKRFIGAFVLLVTLVGCSSPKEQTLSLDETNAFMRDVFNTIVASDFDTYLKYCVHPDDVGSTNGKALMASYKAKDGEWRKYHKLRFDNLMDSIKKAGGVLNLSWKRPGQVQGYFPAENEFVGNMYLEVTTGRNATPMALEFGGTFKSPRGRLLDTDSDVRLLTWEQYKRELM